MAAAVTTARGIPQRKPPVVPSAVIATLVLVLTEIMYFSSLVSSYNVIRAQLFGAWAPPGDVRLPIAATAFNTGLLVISGVTMWFANRLFKKVETRKAAQLLFGLTITLGTCFVAFQGYEWVKLVQYGMTMQSGIFGAIFYLVIGSHAAHVLGAVLVMAYLYVKMVKGRLSTGAMQGMSLFWLFVVLVWPLLYRMVYFA